MWRMRPGPAGAVDWSRAAGPASRWIEILIEAGGSHVL